MVSGLVQGVGFRDFTARTARRLALTGTVRNLRDGRVDVVAEGSRARLLEFTGLIREGPADARVADLQVTWGPASGRFPAFSIEF